MTELTHINRKDKTVILYSFDGKPVYMETDLDVDGYYELYKNYNPEAKISDYKKPLLNRKK